MLVAVHFSAVASFCCRTYFVNLGGFMPIVPFENNDQAHARLAELQKRTRPHLPKPSVLEVAHFHSKFLKNATEHGHWVFVSNGEWVGYADAMIPWWWSAPDALMVRIGVHPQHRNQGIGTQLLKHLVNFAQTKNCVSLGGDVFDLHAEDLRFVDKYGFELKQKDTCSIYNTTNPLSKNLKDTYDRVCALGIEIIRGDQFAHRYPDDWQKMWWAFETKTVADVPCPSERKPMSFEKWRARLSSPSFSPREFFFAFDEGQLVGLSGGVIFPGEPSKGGVHFTGVLKSHRRKKIATALKVAATQHLIDAGVQEIVTNNEKDNPMLKLNEAFGFVPAYACLFYQANVAALNQKLTD